MNQNINPITGKPIKIVWFGDLVVLTGFGRIGNEITKRLKQRGYDFFGIVEQISAVDTTGVVPMAHPVDAMHNSPEMALRLRSDTVSEPNQREANQQSAPAVENGLFLVPKVIE